MKTIVVLFLLSAVTIVWHGCDPGPDDEPVPAEEMEWDAPEAAPEDEQRGYVGTVVRAPADAAERTAIQTVENTLRQYRALHGEWPDSLEALSEWTGSPLPELPQGRHYHYDPSTGDVQIRVER